MEVSYVPVGEALIVAPVGRVDEATWEEFGTHLSRGIDQASKESRDTMVIDLSGIEYMSSRGLRVLTIAKRQAETSGLTITLAAPNEVMREILAISRYDKLFHISDSIDTGK